MKAELDAAKVAMARLMDAWDERLVTAYPIELGDFTEVVHGVLGIQAEEDRDSGLHQLLLAGRLHPGEGRTPGYEEEQVEVDIHTGATFIFPRLRHARMKYVGVDHGINNAWQVYLYWAESAKKFSEGEFRFTEVDLSREGLDVKPDATAAEMWGRLEPFLTAIGIV